MAYPTRQWFKVGSVMVCIDFELRSPVAYVQAAEMKENYKHWSPNQDADLSAFIANVIFDKKRFQYNPHDTRDTEQALLSAMIWCLDKIGPPVHFVSQWAFLLRCIMFWKYSIMWDGLKIMGIKPRGKEWKTQEQKLLEIEWNKIRKQLENE